MKRILVLLAVALCVAGSARAQIVRNATTGLTPADSLLPIIIQLWDSAGYNTVAIDTTLDSAYIIIHYPNGDSCYSDNFALDVSSEGGKVDLVRRYGSVIAASYTDQISNIDGIGRMGNYSYIVVARDSSLKLSNPPFGIRGTFQVLDTLLNTALARLDAAVSSRWAASDSANASASAANKTWGTSFGAAFTAGSMGDSLNNPTYVTNNDSAYVKGNIAGTVAQVNYVGSNAIQSSSFQTGAITSASIADAAIDSATFANDAKKMIAIRADSGTAKTLAASQTFNMTGNITGNLSGSVGSVTNDVGVKSPDTIAVVLNVNNIASTDTITTVLGNVNGSVASVTAKTGYSLSDAAYGVAADSLAKHSANASLPDTTVGGALRELHDSLDTQTWASTGSASSIDSLMIRRWVWDSTSGKYIQGGVLYKRTADSVYLANIKAADTVSLVTLATTTTSVTNDVGVKADDTVLYVRHVDTVLYVAVAGTANSVNIKPDDTVLYVRHVDSVITSPSGTGLDSATTSRIIGRKAWGIAAGNGSDSVAATLRYIANPGGSSAGTGDKPESLYVVDTSGADTRISGAKITLQNSAMTLTSPFILTTNASGYAIFNTDASTTYKALADYGGYLFPLRTFTTSAGATAGMDSIPGYDLVPGATSPGTQKTTLYDTPRDAGGNTLPYATVTITLVGSMGAYTSTTAIVPGRIVARANSSGLWEASIYGNDSLYVGGVGSTTSYDIKIEHSNLVQPVTYQQIFVPANGATTTLLSLLP